MDQSKREGASAGTLPTSPALQRKPRSNGAIPLLATGNALLLAMIRDLLKGRFPLELRNVQVDGVWVAHIRLRGQMWTESAGLKPSEKVASSIAGGGNGG